MILLPSLRFGYSLRYRYLVSYNFFHYFSYMFSDIFLYHFFKGFFPFSSFHFHKVHSSVHIFLSHSGFVLPQNLISPFTTPSSGVFRFLSYYFKSRFFFHINYSFPLHDLPFLFTPSLLPIISTFSTSKQHVGFSPLLKLFKFKSRANIIGLKLVIKGKSPRKLRSTKETFQFGSIPNTPTSSLNQPIFYDSKIIFTPLGVYSISLLIVYRPNS